MRQLRGTLGWSLILWCALSGAGATDAFAKSPEKRWSATLYAGPSTSKWIGAVVQSFNFETTGAMAGLAVDRPFLDIGWDVALSGEAQVTQYFFGHSNTSFAAGLGFQANEPFGWRNTSLSVHSGPSYSLNPPATSIGYSGKIWPSSREKFLNYLSLEFAVALPKRPDWDVAFRFYHRSGVFGLYSVGNDEGSAVGIGIRHMF